MKNPIRWFEIYVNDMSRAKAFYERVFQLKLSPISAPTNVESPEVEMWGFPSDPDEWGCSGSLVRMKGLSPNGMNTIVYFGSEDCAIEEGRVVESGGQIHKSKFSIGQYGFITLAVDTEGTLFGIHSMK